jgi:DNA ligase-1
VKSCMLADPVEFDKLVYPLLGSIKLDGIRCWLPEGKPVTRNLKPIPNKFVQAQLTEQYAGLDGELIVGNPADPDCYRKTNSAVMSVTGEPDFDFWVFDYVFPFVEDMDFYARYAAVETTAAALPRCKVVDQIEIHNHEQLLAFEQEALDAGHEGIMLRRPEKPYKFGRSTAKGGELLKLKRFVDAEARVIGYFEEMKNNNVATTNALGRTERSSHQENKSGKGTLGGFRCRELAAPHAEFDLGGGFTAAHRAEFWSQRDSMVGRIVKFKHFEIGRKDAPRFPIWLGFRDEIDL